MKVQAIIASAGTGERLGTAEAKPFVPAGGRPLVSYALEIFERCQLIDSIVVAAECSALDRMKALADQFGLKKIKHITAGGKTRAGSVKNALAVLDHDTDYVIIHDGARPLITLDFLEQMLKESFGQDAVIAAVPVKPTIKRVDPKTLYVQETLNRASLWDVQTPQIFCRAVLEEAYRADDLDVTDDAALVERLGKPVKIFPGLEQNIKVTTQYDLMLAEKFLGGRS